MNLEDIFLQQDDATCLGNNVIIGVDVVCDLAPRRFELATEIVRFDHTGLLYLGLLKKNWPEIYRTF